MKNKILLSALFLSIFGLGTATAQVVVEKKEEIKKEVPSEMTKEERKALAEKRALYKDGPRKDFRKAPYRKDFRKDGERMGYRKGDYRRSNNHPKMRNHRMNRENAEVAVMHKECIECMKIKSKIERHKIKKHSKKSQKAK